MTRKTAEPEMDERSTLEIHWRFKHVVSEAGWFENTANSSMMMKARMNMLGVMARRYGEELNKLCVICQVDETLKPFLLWYSIGSEVRGRSMFLQQPYEEDTDMVIGTLLFFWRD